MFHELLSRGREDGRATGQPQGVGPEAYLNGMSQGTTHEDAQKDGHTRGRSKQLMKHPGLPGSQSSIDVSTLRSFAPCFRINSSFTVSQIQPDLPYPPTGFETKAPSHDSERG